MHYSELVLTRSQWPSGTCTEHSYVKFSLILVADPAFPHSGKFVGESFSHRWFWIAAKGIPGG